MASGTNTPSNMFIALETALNEVKARKATLDALGQQVTAASEAYQAALVEARAAHARVNDGMAEALPPPQPVRMA